MKNRFDARTRIIVIRERRGVKEFNPPPPSKYQKKINCLTDLIVISIFPVRLANKLKTRYIFKQIRGLKIKVIIDVLIFILFFQCIFK